MFKDFKLIYIIYLQTEFNTNGKYFSTGGSHTKTGSGLYGIFYFIRMFSVSAIKCTKKKREKYSYQPCF